MSYKYGRISVHIKMNIILINLLIYNGASSILREVAYYSVENPMFALYCIAYAVVVKYGILVFSYHVETPMYCMVIGYVLKMY